MGRTAMVREGERDSRRPETDGVEETGQHGSGVRRPGKAFDTILKEMVMATLRWMGVYQNRK